jgi:hypothetical protein
MEVAAASVPNKYGHHHPGVSSLCGRSVELVMHHSIPHCDAYFTFIPGFFHVGFVCCYYALNVLQLGNN